MSQTPTPVIYKLKVVLLGISPMIWRRIKVSSDSTIADLHYIIQIAMGWKDEHLHQFLIHGVHYGISYPGAGGFINNAHEVKLSQFGWREREKFSYEYDFFSNWKHQKHSRFELAVRVAEIILDGGIEEVANHKEELTKLNYWATINDKIDCSKINNWLQKYATEDEAWRESLVQTITIK